MNNLFFFEIEKIQRKEIFQIMRKKNFFFSYFSLDQKYYLLVFKEQEIDRDLIYSFLNIIQEIDSQKRKIRSFRGFFLYILKLFKKAKHSKILETNLKPYFWPEISSVIRQNNTEKLLKFLFGPSNTSISLLDRINSLENKVINLENKIKSLTDQKNQA